MTSKDCLDRYFALMEQRPLLFADSDIIPIVKDRPIIEKFVEKTGQRIGVIYQSKYNFWIVDLICDKNGTYYTYERVVPSADGRGIVCIPVYKGNYVLLKQYRHAIRKTQICFPRGYGENGISSCDSAKRELYEEIGATVKSIKKLGVVTADSGLTAAITDVYMCEIDSYNNSVNSEGIVDIFLCSHAMMKTMIDCGEISDSFTICAFAMLEHLC